MGVNVNSIVLNNGMEIPIPGFGTDQVPDGETVINAVTWLLSRDTGILIMRIAIIIKPELVLQ